jgi:hypothetical protein
MRGIREKEGVWVIVACISTHTTVVELETQKLHSPKATELTNLTRTKHWTRRLVEKDIYY